MPHPSQSLQDLAASRKFDEVSEIVRVFTVCHAEKKITVRIMISRYYTETGEHFHLEYEREDDQGVWHDASYGQVLNGSESEEQTIRVALSFINDAHGLLA